MIKRVLSVIIMIILVGGYGYFLYLYCIKNKIQNIIFYELSK